MTDPQASAPAQAPRPATVYTLDRLLIRVLGRRRLFVGVTFGAAVLTVLISLVLPREFTSMVSFLPASQGGAGSALAGLASEVGINVGTGGGEDSPDFYADFLLSDQLLGEIAGGRYPVRGAASRDTSLLDYLDVSQADSSVRVAKAVQKLRRHLTAATSAKTSVVTLRASFDDPQVAYAVASRAMDLVNRFNVQSRQTQAGAQRRFLETQVQTTADQLRAAEDSLLGFMSRNRNYQNSPTLTFTYDRLQRSVTMRQGAYAQVFNSYLQAQAAEVQNTPVITIVGPVRLPSLPNPRHLPVRALFAMIVSALLLLLGMVVLDAWRELRAGNATLAELADATRAELLRLAGRKGRTGSGPGAAAR